MTARGILLRHTSILNCWGVEGGDRGRGYPNTILARGRGIPILSWLAAGGVPQSHPDWAVRDGGTPVQHPWDTPHPPSPGKDLGPEIRKELGLGYPFPLLTDRRL